ncbi:hypothetical protein DM860_010517 [Cuscuta australis]|uniref:Protein kinase domain-containing protein n=1 Tax=Cuscuta australis TaxID=267555 RepID=A0A328E5C5_9ASTE|nr:hypothetical protein DM860_010517 [Cuscuta australis]
MSSRSLWFWLNASMFAALACLAFSCKDELEVQTLREMYKALNCPPQLENWGVEGGDPCEDHWVGVSCLDSSVIRIKLNGLNLTGHLDFQISNLQQLTELDLSSNNVEGEISLGFPLNLTSLSLAFNNFSGRIPDSLSGLKTLKNLDLSYNNLTGDLPSSFAALTNLAALFLQNNSLTGSVNLLSQLPLRDLNIEDNHFSGVIPETFQEIRNLWLGGNRFDRIENYTPWNFPLDFLHEERNASSSPLGPPSTQIGGHKRKKRLSIEGLFVIVIGATIVAISGGVLIFVWLCGSHKQLLGITKGKESSRHSCPTNSTVIDLSAAAQEDSRQSSRIRSLREPLGLQPPPARAASTSSICSSKICEIPMCVKPYAMAEIESATNGFSQENLIGEGCFGYIYRAEFSNGQLSIVNRINIGEPTLVEEQLLDLVRTASRLRHPNIITLVGYTLEAGHCVLVYEHIRNVSLSDALHNDASMNLSWSLRLRVAVGVSRALNYMHSSCVPPIAHGNLMASRILLDEDLRPHVSECGLATLNHLTEFGYGASQDDDVQGRIRSTKEDVYAFGVLLLELLTGRRRSEEERGDLVQWSIPRLHDNASLAQMVDPIIRNTIPPKTLSHLADIVLLCLQAEEFRAPMSEVVEALMCLVQKSSGGCGGGGGSRRRRNEDVVSADPFDRSFRSTSTHFISSPTHSYYSI